METNNGRQKIQRKDKPRRGDQQTLNESKRYHRKKKLPWNEP